MITNRYLLDTHTLIWFQENSIKLPKRILEIIQNSNNDILFSQISLFEIAIKQNIGKLPQFSASVKEIYNQAITDNFTFVNIQNSHLYQYKDVILVEQHRDPFDRLLIATALEENVIILSGDSKFKLYENLIKVVWD